MSDPTIPAEQEDSTAKFGCECIGQLNTLLAEQGSNTVIGDSLVLDLKSGEHRVIAEIATYKRDPKKREKARGMIPTFCPFCGTRYVPEESEAMS